MQRDSDRSGKARGPLVLSEAAYRAAFRRSPSDLNLNRLRDGVYLDVSDGFTAAMGFSRQDVEGKTAVELGIWQNPEDRDRFVAKLRREGFVDGMEMRFRRKDGSVGTGLLSARVIEVDGEPCILSATTDITDRVRYEQQLRQAERLLREAQAVGKLGGWEYDVAGGQITWTDEVYRIFGVTREYDPNDIDGSISFYAPHSRPLVAQAFRRAVEHGEPYDLELEFDRADGSASGCGPQLTRWWWTAPW